MTKNYWVPLFEKWITCSLPNQQLVSITMLVLLLNWAAGHPPPCLSDWTGLGQLGLAAYTMRAVFVLLVALFVTAVSRNAAEFEAAREDVPAAQDTDAPGNNTTGGTCSCICPEPEGSGLPWQQHSAAVHAASSWPPPEIPGKFIKK